MTPIRKFFYSVACVAAFLALMQVPFAFALSSVFSNPANIDTALKEGGVYDNFVPLVLEDISKKSTDEETKKLVSDQGFKDAITSSVESEDIQAAGQSVITGLYAWLEGKTNQPEFKIDLSQPAARATDKLAAYAEERAAGLPTCTIAQLQTVDFEKDLLSIPCLPPGVSASQVGQQFADQAKQDIELLRNPVIDSKELVKEADTAQLESSQAPELYQNLHNSKWMTAVLAAILVTLLIFARRNRLAGLRLVGILLLVCTGLIGLMLLLSAGSGQVTADTKIAEVAGNTILSLADQLTAVIRWFVVGYAVAGIVALITVRKMKQSQPTDTDDTPNNPVIVS